MEKSGNDRQLHMRIRKFTQIGSCVDDDMASLQKNPTLIASYFWLYITHIQ
jgi:hypothetical protein